MSLALAALFALTPLSQSQASTPALDPKAQEIILRTRSSNGTYTIYWRTYGGEDGAKTDFAWGATFRRGPLLRYESRDKRVVADCAARTATRYYDSIGRNEYSSGLKIAKSYCGIDSELGILSSQYLGQVESKFGLLDKIRVADREAVHVYSVTSGGEIVGVASNYQGSKYTIIAEPMSFDQSVPAGDLFTRKSLTSSKVSKALQSRGSRPAN
jgi:hypothetical protein